MSSIPPVLRRLLATCCLLSLSLAICHAATKPPSTGKLFSYDLNTLNQTVAGLAGGSGTGSKRRKMTARARLPVRGLPK